MARLKTSGGRETNTARTDANKNKGRTGAGGNKRRRRPGKENNISLMFISMALYLTLINDMSTA